jgi:hypothetical protein
MKIVREHINEKFVEDSDPVTDMGIGIRAQISRWMKENGWTDTDDNALAECAKHGKIEWIKFLLSLKNYPQTNIDIGLRFASYHGHLEVVKELLKAGANVHAQNDEALHWAKYGRNQDVVDFLEDYIANEKKSKAVRESLFEKFFEDSDPVTDMGIGINSKVESHYLECLGLTIFNDDYYPLNNPELDDLFVSLKEAYPEVVDYLIDLEKRGLIEYGKFFRSQDLTSFVEYLHEKEKEYEYIYDAGVELDGYLPLFSEIEFPNADKFTFK